MMSPRQTGFSLLSLLLTGMLSATLAFTTPAPNFAVKRCGASSSSISSSNMMMPIQPDSRDEEPNSRLTIMHPTNRKPWEQVVPKFMAIGMIAFSTLLGPFNLFDNSQYPMVPVAEAADSRIVGELKGSGLVFKDTLEIESFDDPKVKGVSLYVSNFQRPLTERLSKDFFSDPSAAALGCAKTGPVQIADNIVIGKEGEEVFKESKSLLFKSLRVQRLYDQQKNTVVYVLFNTRLDKNDDSNKSRFKSSLCAVSLDEGQLAADTPLAQQTTP